MPGAAKTRTPPYSGFAVGAAILTVEGGIFAGCNVENVAYPEGTCAEAGAIAAMVASGERAIAQVLVVAGGPRLVSPCGGCRQKIAEFAGPETKIHLADPTGVRRTVTLGALLPGAFGPEHLEEA